MKNSLLLVALLGALSIGASKGCSDAPKRITTCPVLACDFQCGVTGYQHDANGCDICACNEELHPMDAGYYPADSGVDAGPQTTSCVQDSDCQVGELCDVINYCDAPPGCDPYVGCPAVCYGRCVTGSNPSCEGAAWGPTGVCQGPDDGPLPESCCQGQSNPCEGAVLDSSGQCVSPNGSILGAQCCPPPTNTCGDGSEQLCDRPAIPNCVGPLVAAPYNNCTWCFDAMTCERQCFVDSDCDPGQACKPDLNDGCYGPTVRCNRPGVMTCQATNECPGVLCDVYCPYGNVIDASGCETCACNPPPENCVCPDLYSPVCGRDGQTYSNSCEADCADVTVAYEGACTPTCEVDCIVSDPVCGADGVTYNCGAADAECHHTTVAYEGACTDTCNIACLIADPVCGADGVTYSCGAADAECHHTTVAYEGACGPLCAVECFVADPVCGADGVTYTCGEPDALCHRTTVAYDGPCEQACSTDSDCPSGTACYFPAPAPNERPAPRGKCEPPDYCQTAADCSSHPSPACVGSWSCLRNACTYACGL